MEKLKKMYIQFEMDREISGNSGVVNMGAVNFGSKLFSYSKLSGGALPFDPRLVEFSLSDTSINVWTKSSESDITLSDITSKISIELRSSVLVKNIREITLLFTDLETEKTRAVTCSPDLLANVKINYLEEQIIA